MRPNDRQGQEIEPRLPGRWVVPVMAVATGASVANLYYAQPLLDSIAHALHVSPSRATLAVAFIQIGYAAGLLLLLPLADMRENRRLVTSTLIATAGALALTAVSADFSVLIVALTVVGLTSVVAQILVPFAAYLAPEHRRGQVVGQVTGGLLMGIMLARALSSFVAAAFGWRAIFIASSCLMLLMSAILTRVLPRRTPEVRASYASLLVSTVALLRGEPVLRHRAALQGLLFGAFTAFWTGVGHELVKDHGFGQGQVGLFALVGAAGALVAPFAGRLADRRVGKPGRLAVTGVALMAGVLAWAGSGSVVVLALAGVLLDVGVQSGHVFNLRDVYALRPDARARINAAYMGTIFIAGALSSAIEGTLQSHGWSAIAALVVVCLIGAGLLGTRDPDRVVARQQPLTI